MAAEVKFDTSRWAELASKFDDMAERMADLSPILKPAAQGLDTVIRKSFSSQSDPNTGEMWARLSDVTTAQKRKNVDRKLRERDQLFRSISTDSDRQSVFFGIGNGEAAEYALVHQFGKPDNRMPKRVKGSKPAVWRKDGPSAPIPARPYLPLGDDGKAKFSGGRALTWYRRTLDRVAAYVLHGKAPTNG